MAGGISDYSYSESFEFKRTLVPSEPIGASREVQCPGRKRVCFDQSGRDGCWVEDRQEP